jgi:phospholipid/cholesterol/gamma-HCH transport system permease protein
MKNKIDYFLEEVGKITLLFLEAFYWIGKNLVNFSFNLKNIIVQMAFIGFDSLPIISITGFFTGAVLVLQIGMQFSNFGAERYIGGVVALALARELAPVLTAIVIAGRIGAAIAAEIGSMNVTEQIDALKTLATSPVDYLVVPRVIAAIVMLPILTIITNTIGAVGGAVSAIFQVKISLVTFKSSVLQFLTFKDFWGGLLKSSFFGLIIAIIASYMGFNTRGGASGVGKSTTYSVVLSIMLILISNYFLSSMLFNVSEGYIK